MIKVKYQINLKLAVIAIFFFLKSPMLEAQIKKNPLSIGDSLPNFYIAKIINSKKTSAQTSELKKNLLILDFWGMGCKSCIEIMPKLASLEKTIGSKLKILPISTYGKAAEVSEFWKQNKHLKNLSFPSVVEDVLFKKYFPTKLIPHEVWVYNGRIIAITNEEYVTEQNIRYILNGGIVNWPIKDDFYLFDYAKPIFEIDEQQLDTNKLVKYSAISDYKEHVNSTGLSGGAGIVRDKRKKTVRAYFLNQPILNSYLTEWSYLNNLDSLILPSPQFFPNQVVWNVADKSLYVFEKKVNNYTQDWVRRNGICFESLDVDTGQSDNQIHQSIIKDMNRLLGLHVRWERHQEKVIVIKKNVKTVGKVEQGTYTIWEIINQLNNIADNPYIFNETNDILTKLPIPAGEFTSLTKVSKILESNGFKMNDETRLVDRLVFTEVDAGRVVDSYVQKEAKTKRNQQEKTMERHDQDSQMFLAENKRDPTVFATSSGLQYKVIVDGKGERPQLNNKLVVRYEGRLANGKIFDSTYENGVALLMTTQTDLPGLTEALRLMKIGSIWEIYIPAKLGFGNHTGHGMVPPNSALIYKIELVRVINPN